MEYAGQTTDSLSPEARQFNTTHWSVVLSAGRSESTRAQESLAQLCKVYWYPLYAFVRRQGYGPDDAKDLTQEFFARLISKKYLDDVDRSKGKFRSFLLASLKHFLANEWDKAQAQKRGGGQVFIPLDAHSAETRYRLEPSHEMTAEKIYERRWALTILEEVLKYLREEYVREGKVKLFEELKDVLAGASDSASYAEIAGKIGMTEGAVKVAVHRMRHRYRALLRAEIANTVENPAEIDDELRHLFEVLSG
jgi:RNA polymerase sigma-70 factor (ECF subfamily)